VFLPTALLLDPAAAAAVGGIVPIVISWFLSPLMAALITLVLFLVVRTLVLRRANSTKIAFYVLPVLILLTFFINLFFILVSQQTAIEHVAFALSIVVRGWLCCQSTSRAL
jgi:phosphate/sulfate permease